MVHDASMKRHTGYTRIARVVVGDRVFVGAGAIILPGTRIGDDSIVGAGAVVRGEIPPGSLVVGNPAKVVADVKAIARWHRNSVAAAPVWPHEGWMIGRGITQERMREQREALAGGISGYLEATPAAEPTGSGGRSPQTGRVRSALGLRRSG